MADRPRRLCIVSGGDRLLSGNFMEALQASLHPKDDLQIIMNRRQDGSPMPSGLEDRRRNPRVDLALQVDGFAIVPASGAAKRHPTEASLSLAEAPLESLSSEDDEVEERRESVRHFKRLRSGGLIPNLFAFLIGMMLAMFALSPSAQNLWVSLVGPMSEGPAPTSGSQTKAPPAGPLRSTDQPAQIDEPTNTEPIPLRDADRLIVTRRETGPPPNGAGTTSREPDTPSGAASASPKETSAPPNAVTAEDDSGRPRPEATVRPRPSASPRPKQLARTPLPEPETSMTTPPLLFAASQRAELARKPVSVGWGESYTVRLLDSADQPVAGTEVWLVARMANGTVANIPMGALPESGTYRATVPTDQSTPVDLWVRVTNGDKHVELPLRP